MLDKPAVYQMMHSASGRSLSAAGRDLFASTF